MSKPCKKCGLTDRYKSRACRPCSKKYYAQWKKEHPERTRQLYVARRDADPDRNKNKKLEKNYGIDVDIYTSLLEKQDNKCAICKTQKCPTGRRFSVDHCHATNSIRGLLCVNCNQGLGNFKDSSERLIAAITYLKLTASL